MQFTSRGSNVAIGDARISGVNRLVFARVLFLSAACAAAAAAQQDEAAQQPKTNILFITVDTLRADHLSSWGYHLETSPNIDKLASEGVRYSNAYTVTTRTAPSHMSMFTSRYPQEHGVKLNGFAPPPESKFLVLPQLLRKFGYKTGAFVSSWVLTAKLTKLDKHFDTYEHKLSRTYQGLNSMRYAEDVNPPALAWLERNKDNPFFLWVHYFDPHSPYDFREDFNPTKKTGRPDLTKERLQESILEDVKAYNSEIFYTDHYVGKLLERLDSLGLKENTLVVLVADHGESLGERDYQGHSRRLFQSIVHIPMILRMPGTIEAGRVVESRVTLMDLAPTILDLTVKKQQPEAQIPTEFVGRSLAENLELDAELPDRIVRYIAFAGQKWVMPKWFAKLWLRDLDFPLRTGALQGNRKTIWTPENEDLLVFDLSQDPFEHKPSRHSDGDKEYQRETSSLTKWFKATHIADGENQMDADDREKLESLGYIQ